MAGRGLFRATLAGLVHFSLRPSAPAIGSVAREAPHSSRFDTASRGKKKKQNVRWSEKKKMWPFFEFFSSFSSFVWFRELNQTFNALIWDCLSQVRAWVSQLVDIENRIREFPRRFLFLCLVGRQLKGCEEMGRLVSLAYHPVLTMRKARRMNIQLEIHVGCGNLIKFLSVFMLRFFRRDFACELRADAVSRPFNFAA